MTLVGALILLMVLLVCGIPIPLTFIASAMFFIFFGGYNFMSLMPYGFSTMNSIVLMTIPLFIMVGSLMNKGGIGNALVTSVEKIVGNRKGGLAIIAVLSCGVFSSVCGSSSATLAAIGSILSPRLRENGYDPGFYGALIASSGVLGILIPPSALMILYAWSGGQSVLASFLATLVPAFLLIIFFTAVSLYWSVKDPNIIVHPKPTREEAIAEKMRKKAAKERGPLAALLMPIFILGSIYGGFLTPTEAAALAVFYAIPVGFFVYKTLKLKSLIDTFIQSGITTGVIMVMLFSVMILSRLLVMENLPQSMLKLVMLAAGDNKMVMLLLVNLFIIVVGMLMDDVSGVLLTTPILLPVVTAYGVHPIHFAGIIGVNLGMGNVTPPTAPLLYLASRVCDADIKDMLKPTLALIAFAWLPALMLTTYIPGIALAVPRFLGYV